MEPTEKAVFRVYWSSRSTPEDIEVQFNPTQLSFQKGAHFADLNIPGLDSPLLQFVRGEGEKLTLDLFFDTTEDGMGMGATSVTTKTDRIYQLLKIEPDRHAPPICEFAWGPAFPGSDVSGESGNQKRDLFKCVVESVKQDFTLFSPEGIPLRATLTVTLREYKSLDEQFPQINHNSPDKTRVHVLERGDTLSSVAAKHYLRPGEWRRVAEGNNIQDPRRLTAGTFLSLPPV